jgi:hypothetical protein
LRLDNITLKRVKVLLLVSFGLVFKVGTLWLSVRVFLTIKGRTEFASRAKLVRVEKVFFFNLPLKKKAALSPLKVATLLGLKKPNLCPSKLLEKSDLWAALLQMFLFTRYW